MSSSKTARCSRISVLADGWTELRGTFDRFAAMIFYLRNVEGTLVLS
jgi:hypothetical protein